MPAFLNEHEILFYKSFNFPQSPFQFWKLNVWLETQDPARNDEKFNIFLSSLFLDTQSLLYLIGSLFDFFQTAAFPRTKTLELEFPRAGLDSHFLKDYLCFLALKLTVHFPKLFSICFSLDVSNVSRLTSIL